MTYICVSKLAIIGSDNGLLPGRRQVINWISVGILFIGPSGINCNFNRNVHIFIQENAFENVVCKMASILSRPQCADLKTPKLRITGQAITRTNAGILLIRPLGTNVREILSKRHTFSYKKIHLKMSGK